MKLSISLPDDDVAFVDEYALRAGDNSRSAVLHRAIDMLRMAELESAYAEAWNDWVDSEDAECWDKTIADGLADAPR